MLGIIILIFVLRSLGMRAHDKGQNRYVYWGIGLVVWFGSQFIFGMIAGMIWPEMFLDNSGDDMLFIGLGIIVSAISIGILYYYVDRMPDPDDSNQELVNQIGVDP